MVSNLTGGFIMAGISVGISLILSLLYCLYLRTEPDFPSNQRNMQEEHHSDDPSSDAHTSSHISAI